MIGPRCQHGILAEFSCQVCEPETYDPLCQTCDPDPAPEGRAINNPAPERVWIRPHTLPKNEHVEYVRADLYDALKGRLAVLENKKGGNDCIYMAHAAHFWRRYYDKPCIPCCPICKRTKT